MILGITSIQRDRGPYIKEWIAFHYLVGFRKFYMYLHKCSDDTEKVLNDLQNRFDIKIIIVPDDWSPPQMRAYEDSCKNYLQEVDWMAFLDADEFLFPTHTDSMEVALKEFEDKKISALGVYWSCFGSSGYIDEPSGLIIENYRYKAGSGFHNNRHVKSLLRSENEPVGFFDYHTFRTQSGTVDEHFRPITHGWTDYEPTYDKFRINHFTTQSRSYFLNFKNKYSTPDNSPPRTEAYWEECDTNDELDNSMDRFIIPVKDILKNL